MIKSVPMPASVQRLAKPPEKLTVSQWCDRYRYLDRVYSAESGPWRTSRIPYIREILDSIADPTVSWVVWAKSARVGGTEAATCIASYAIDRMQGNILWVLPAEQDAKQEASRLKICFENCTQVMSHVTDPRSWYSDDEGFSFDAMKLWMGYSSTPRTLIRKTCRIVILDEQDNIERSCHEALGDIVTLSAERTATWGRRGRVFACSTPTTDDGSCWKLYQSSDKRRFHVPCPTCGRYQVLFLAGIRCDLKEPDQIQAHQCATYECEECQAAIPQSERQLMLERGVWVPECQEITEPYPVGKGRVPDGWRPQLAGEPHVGRRIGFHLSSLYSPWRTWSDILAEFLRVKDDPDRLRVFVNSWLGEPWVEKEQALDIDVLRSKLPHERCPRRLVPVEAIMLVAGADVQKDFLWYTVRAWGPHEESWLIDFGTAEDFEHLYDVLFRQAYRREDDAAARVRAVGIDSGYRTDEVYEFAAAHPECVLAVKGQDTADWYTRLTPVTFMGSRSRQQHSLTLMRVNTDYFKTKAHRLARLPAGHTSEWHLPRDVTEEYMQHFTSEHQVWVRTGKKRLKKLVWQKKADSRRNEMLDTEVYGLAVADYLGCPRFTAEHLQELMAASTTPAADRPQRQRWVDASGWLPRQS